MAYKTNYIDVNKPAKVLSLNVTTINNDSQWPHNDGVGDKWYSGGSNPKFYRWEVIATVSAQTHGSHLTRKDFEYNGLDIQVGDWIAGATTGLCCRIISVSSKTATTVTMIVEDWLRYNTFRSGIGNGIFGTGPCVIFQLNENGHPMVDPLPTSIVSSDFYQNINSRFQYLNPQMHYVLDQTAHGFSAGDVISITGSGFAKTTTASANKTIGTVTNPGPGPNQFMIRPNTRIIDFNPAIPGSVGDFIYTDDSTAGGLTTNSTSGKIQFLKIADAIPTSVTGTQVDPTVTASDVIEINETAVTLTGGNLTQTISDINGGTSTHGVTASSSPSPTTATTSTESLAYGLVGVYPGGAITINGTSVSFTTTTSGQATYGIAVGIAADIAADINSASPTNITATVSGTDVVLTESTGGAITIVNVSNDGNGTAVAGPSSGTGFALSTGASSGAFLKLTRTDGGEILLDETTGTPLNALGIFSVHNGRQPLAVTVEQGIVAGGGSTTVVADITARNALSPSVGDLAYVIDNGNGEYAFYVYSGGAWKLLADEDSANTDANTINVTLTQAGGTANTNIGTMSDGARVTMVTVKVTTPFDTTDATLTIGDSGDNDRLMSDNEIDLTSAGQYTATPGYQYTTGGDQSVVAYFNVGTSTTGTVEVAVTYV
tara:strand:- start:3313 stop:5292 length:1980 start_codon:yes stop_codon:yes gene_type:complete